MLPRRDLFTEEIALQLTATDDSYVIYFFKIFLLFFSQKMVAFLESPPPPPALMFFGFPSALIFDTGTIARL